MNENTKRQGLAITSLVLGIFSLMCFGLFAGIPAIISGHIAHGRARKSPERYAGGGLAIAGFIMGYASVVTTLILAGLLLPALAKMKSKAQSIQCINNLKQVGLAFRIWASDHNDQFPNNLSTNQVAAAQPGKTAALSFEQEGARILQQLAGQLATPKILVCPEDSSKRPATSFMNLGPSNVSYEIETGPEVKESNPQEVLARCPIHGHELYCDGSVRQSGWR